MRRDLILLFAAFASPSFASASPPPQAGGSACPDVRSIVTTEATDFSSKEAWLHEPGWFEPLEGVPFVALKEAQLRPDTQMLVVSHGSDALAIPVPPMAYHHVANVHVGKDYPVAFTF